ncbi:NUDT9 [Mytilus edulis]|uniref:NUDT9 n=1 Tax=Mytilus edulis TaxID=6550 RepID=A0A8S3RWV1_MYTED|nr:NUDT9 [Mytilus edulis]
MIKCNGTLPFPEYSPPSFTTETVLSGPYYEIQIYGMVKCYISSGKGEITKWNEIDGKVSRVSFEGKYEVVDGLPLNPVGRTGIKHRGCLGRWGPNHAADPIMEKNQDDEIVKGKDGKQVMEFVSIQRRDNREWAIPGGKIDAGEVVTDTVLREFGEEALSTKEISQEEKDKAVESMKQFFTKGIKVYEGYVDDPRNTDNAWMETTAYHFHDHDGTKVGQFNLHAGDDAMAVQWMVCNSSINLYASHKSFLQEAAKRIDASCLFNLFLCDCKTLTEEEVRNIIAAFKDMHMKPNAESPDAFKDWMKEFSTQKSLYTGYIPRIPTFSGDN